MLLADEDEVEIGEAVGINWGNVKLYDDPNLILKKHRSPPGHLSSPTPLSKGSSGPLFFTLFFHTFSGSLEPSFSNLLSSFHPTFISRADQMLKSVKGLLC